MPKRPSGTRRAGSTPRPEPATPHVTARGDRILLHGSFPAEPLDRKASRPDKAPKPTAIADPGDLPKELVGAYLIG